MTTGKDYGLPAEYADWVEAEWPVYRAAHEPALGGRYLRVAIEKHDLDNFGADILRCVRIHHFVPPKPKPTLPDVKLGGVVRYTDTEGQPCLAVRIGEDQWVNFTREDETPAKLWAANPWTDDELLDDADDDGFTVELDGLA